jgi:MYXO-CTERM domain-containing protein
VRKPAALAVALLALGLTPLAHAADWPVARHDAARTAESPGVLPAGPPEALWRAYMGGRPSDSLARFGLSSPSLLVVAAGGRVLGKDVVTQATVWKSALLGDVRIAGFADLDGDGAREIVVLGETRVFVLGESSGAVLWASDPALFHAPAAARLVDLDGDGLADLAVDECSSCAAPGPLTGAAYNFAASFASPKTLYTLAGDAFNAGFHSGTDTFVELGGGPTLVLGGGSTARLLRGADGTPLLDLPAPAGLTKPYPQIGALAAELDGLPGNELVLVQTSGAVSDGSGPPGLFAFHVDLVAGSFVPLFSATVGSFDGELAAGPDVLADLDGDGTSEVVFCQRSPATAGAWLTRVLRGSDGVVLAEIPDARFEGSADLDGQPGDELVLATTAGLMVFRLEGGGASPIAGPLPGVRAFSLPDEALRARGPLHRRIATLQRAGAPVELFVGAPTNPSALSLLDAPAGFSDVRAVTLSAQSSLDVLATFAPASGQLVEAFRADFSTRPYEQLAVGLSTGAVVVLGAQLDATNGTTWLGDVPEGTRVGGARQPSTGIAAGPLVGRDDGGPFVVLPGTPAGCLVGDARDASWIVAPTPRWLGARVGAPSIIDLGPGLGVSVVGVEDNDLVARRAQDGVELGRRALGPGFPVGTPLPLHIGGPAPLVGVDWRIEGYQIVQSAVDFGLGQLVYAGAPLPYGGFFGSGAGDLDGNGIDSWFAMNGPLTERDAATGTLTVHSDITIGYAIPLVAPMTGAATELLLQGTAGPPRLVDSAFQTLWQVDIPDATNGMGGTRALCPDGTRFVTPAVRSPTLRSYQGQTGALVAAQVLAAGQLYPSVQAAEAAGATPGILGNVSVATQEGVGPVALVGSSDGFLYALSACDLGLVWAVDLGAPVAEPVVGDVDDDGEDELVVGSSDGYVLGLDWAGLAPPEPVTVAVPSGFPQAAIPWEPVTVDWPEVDGATFYQIALVDPDDLPIWEPPYRDLAETTLLVDMEGALPGRPYRFAVRAANDAGERSVFAFSPPVIYKDDVPPELDAWLIPVITRLDIHLHARDDVALDHYQLRYRFGTQAELVPLAEGRLEGWEDSVVVPWEPPIAIYGRTITIVAEAFDAGGNVTTRTLVAEVGFDLGTGSYVRTRVVGCDCRAAPTETPAGLGLASLGLLALLLWRRSARFSAGAHSRPRPRARRD